MLERTTSNMWLACSACNYTKNRNYCNERSLKPLGIPKSDLDRVRIYLSVNMGAQNVLKLTMIQTIADQIHKNYNVKSLKKIYRKLTRCYSENNDRT